MTKFQKYLMDPGQYAFANDFLVINFLSTSECDRLGLLKKINARIYDLSRETTKKCKTTTSNQALVSVISFVRSLV